MLKLGGVIDRPRQRRRLKNLHLVRNADFANLQCHEISTLGQQQRRRPALLRVVLQRHRIVRRVGDDHVRLRHRGHHAPLRCFALQLANTLLDLRLALRVLVLVTHFLLGHLHFLVRLPQLERHVRCRDQQQPRRHPQRTPTHHLQTVDDRLLQRLVGNRQQRLAVTDQHHHRHDQDREELDQCLEQFGQGIHREHPFDPRQRAHAAEFRL
ncbi:hypothetical protein D3C79_831220 [compost metagenome]